jgi:hypothetical protein
MFQKLKKLPIPFLRKKATEVSLDELIVIALEEAKNYPLIQDNDELVDLFKNKFMTERGIQIPPKEFVAKIIAQIENNPPQTTDEFAVFVRQAITNARPKVVDTKKR